MLHPLLLSFPTGRRSAELKPLVAAFASALETQRRRGNPRLYAAECGVWKGESLILCARVARAFDMPMTIFGLDTFAGLPELGPRDLEQAPSDAPYRHQRWFTDTSLATVQTSVDEAGFADTIRLVPGLFSHTLSSLPDGPYCFVNVDCDLYEPHLEVLDHFLPRMAPGGIIYFDDFHSEDFPMAREAIKCFLATHEELELVHLRFGEHEANRMKSLVVVSGNFSTDADEYRGYR